MCRLWRVCGVYEPELGDYCDPEDGPFAEGQILGIRM